MTLFLLACLLLPPVASPPAQPAAPPTTLDRNAFTFTGYKLAATVDPAKHSIAVEGDLTLRNDSNKPQTAASLQVSSTLQWKSVTLNGKPVPRAEQRLASDIDHTGSVNETILNLDAVAPRAILTLHVAYAGTVELDSTRLRRLGAPQNIAEQTEWDRIGADITALRGVGYVQWYPMSIEPGSLAEGNVVFERVAAWKARHAESALHLQLKIENSTLVPVSSAGEQTGISNGSLRMDWKRFGVHVPLIVLCACERRSSARGDVYSLAGATGSVERYRQAFDALRVPGFDDAKPVTRVKLVQAPASFAPFEADHLLLMPFQEQANEAAIRGVLTHLVAHAYFRSGRAWLDEGLAHWEQLRYAQEAYGRKAALESLTQRTATLALAEDANDPQPLIAPRDEIFYRTKSQAVLWMLADMVGDGAFHQAIAAYVPENDRQPAYFQQLVETAARRDLEQFFDDWVYRDRGLPEFKVTEVYPRQNLNGGYLVSVTIENSGDAGAEVPVTVRSATNETAGRLWVPAKGKGTIRIASSLFPQTVTVNDGSVPETDPTNNDFAVAPKK